ncbi:MAG TPA: sigma factor, partial [Acidimicrobiales bacterium]
MTASRESEAVDAVVRMEYGRVVAGVAHIVRDVGIAEELVQDALVAALVQWPESGIPDNPGAWLMATAKHRAIDLVRRRDTYARKLAEVGRTLEDVSAPEPGDADDIDDDLLRLIFTA